MQSCLPGQARGKLRCAQHGYFFKGAMPIRRVIPTGSGEWLVTSWGRTGKQRIPISNFFSTSLSTCAQVSTPAILLGVVVHGDMLNRDSLLSALLRPAIVEVLGDALLAAKLGNRLLHRILHCWPFSAAIITQHHAVLSINEVARDRRRQNGVGHLHSRPYTFSLAER
jgi:hypothetical protein